MRQHCLELLSSFAGPMQLLVVRHGSNELGYIDPVSVQGREGKDHIILLAGSWLENNKRRLD
jgi:hypothetical protein